MCSPCNTAAVVVVGSLQDLSDPPHKHCGNRWGEVAGEKVLFPQDARVRGYESEEHGQWAAGDD